MQTQDKMDKMMTAITENQIAVLEQIRVLQPQLDALKQTNKYLFSSYHNLRMLGDAGREDGWTEEKMVELLESNANRNPFIMAAKIAVEGRE